LVQKLRWNGRKPKFPCKLCKGDHLTYLFHGLPEVQILCSLSTISFYSESSKVSSQPIHPLVNKVVMPMQSIVDLNPILGGDFHLDHVVSQPIEPVVEKVVVSMQSLVDPTPLLGGDVLVDHIVSQPI
jgi:hypothetical protein